MNVNQRTQHQQGIQLSSDYTKFYAFVSVITVVLSVLIVVLAVDRSKGTPVTHLLGAIGLVALVGLVIYQLILAAEVELIGKKLIVRKIVGKTYEIDVNEIQKVSSFALRSMKYTTVKFLDEDNKVQRALILNSNSVFFEEEETAADLIREAQQS